MLAKDMRELSREELLGRRAELKQDVVDFRLKVATGVKENVREQRQNRRIIARINTILNERERAAKAVAKQQ